MTRGRGACFTFYGGARSANEHVEPVCALVTTCRLRGSCGKPEREPLSGARRRPRGGRDSLKLGERVEAEACHRRARGGGRAAGAGDGVWGGTGWLWGLWPWRGRHGACRGAPTPAGHGALPGFTPCSHSQWPRGLPVPPPGDRWVGGCPAGAAPVAAPAPALRAQRGPSVPLRRSACGEVRSRCTSS